MQNIVLPQRVYVEKTVDGKEIHWLSGKEKVSGATVNKDNQTVSLLGHKKNPS